MVKAGAVVAASTALLAGGLVGTAQAAVPGGTVLAVTGDNGALYARTAGQASWTNLGGQLLSAPAVASWNGVTHYIGTGTNRTLYHRTGTTGWHRLGPAYCTDVSATAGNGMVHISCRGGNGALYTTEFDARLQLPSTPTMVKRGGAVHGAVPVVMSVNGPVYFARTNEYTEDGQTANTYTYDTRSGWNRYYTWCDSTPAAAAASTLFFACQSGDGLITAEANYYDGAEWAWNFYDVPGQMIDTPALAMTGAETAELFVQGTNRAVYHRGLTIDGPSSGAWTKIDSIVIGGVAATRLHPVG